MWLLPSILYMGYTSSFAFQKLAQLCKDIPVCVAFTPNGMLKSHIPPRSLWKTSKTDVYVVKHGDWCQTDVHVCHVDATCTNDTKGKFIQ